jgi:hypothetical protein
MNPSAALRRRKGGALTGYSGRAALRREKCDKFAQNIARQQLGKHSSSYKYATIGCPVLGNVAVTRLYNNSVN